MQRIIKFRAFNKASGIMYYPEATPGNYNHYLQIGTEGFWLYNKDGQLICTSVNDDVLMQFTGLKDKDWKEIYEGDIIKAADRLFTVVFNDGCFYTVRGLNRFLLGEWPMEGIELIGNIHDTPHLLTPAKGAVTNTMNNLDPNNAQAAPATEPTTEQVAAVEQAAQENAMESADTETVTTAESIEETGG